MPIKTETEVKVLDINHKVVATTLAGIGATPSSEKRLTAVFFDFPDGGLRAAGNLLRLRQEGERVLLTFKRRIGEQGAKVREEIEVDVGDFESSRLLLTALGLGETARVDKCRTSYRLGAASIALDRHVGELSFIPEFLEIEASDVEEVRAVAAKLGFSPNQLLPWGLPQLIEHYRGQPPLSSDENGGCPSPP